MADALERFRSAQQGGVYETALRELRAAAKRSHWMWFIFPQLAGLGRSPTAIHYAIHDRAEAEAYLADAVLGARLAECTDAVLGWAGRVPPEQAMGAIDAMKLRSSLTLFEAASAGGRAGERFTRALDTAYDGARDPQTLALLEGPAA